MGDDPKVFGWREPLSGSVALCTRFGLPPRVHVPDDNVFWIGRWAMWNWKTVPAGPSSCMAKRRPGTNTKRGWSVWSAGWQIHSVRCTLTVDLARPQEMMVMALFSRPPPTPNGEADQSPVRRRVARAVAIVATIYP